MAAGDHQTGEGRRQLGKGDVVGGDVAPDVVHRNQRFSGGKGQALGEVHPHQQRTDQARRIGDGDGVHVGKTCPRVPQGLLHHAVDALHVAAGGDLRHHAAVNGVHIHL